MSGCENGPREDKGQVPGLNKMAGCRNCYSPAADGNTGADDAAEPDKGQGDVHVLVHDD